MTDVVLASTKTLRTLADGGMTVTLDIAPEHFEAAFRLFGKAGSTVGVAAITGDAARKATQRAAVNLDQEIVGATVAEPYRDPMEEKIDILDQALGTGRTAFTKLSRAKQAGIRCNQPAFWVYLSERFAGQFEGIPVVDAEGAANVVRWHCLVSSRRELDLPQGGRALLWDRLEADYYASQHGMR